MHEKTRLSTLTLSLWALVFSGCASPPPTPTATESNPPSPGEPLFLLADLPGLDFAHYNSRHGAFSMPELYGAGAALVDVDNDGDLDMYLVQGQKLGPDEAPDPKLRDRLFRNELIGDRPGSLAFTDITEAAGLDARGYGMGVATGDYDHDGWVDLYVTNLGANQLWRNRGPGPDGIVTFDDVTDDTGAGDHRWSVAAVFWDFDDDRLLDLYVGNYLNFSYAMDRECLSDLGAREYCSPLVFKPEPDLLLRNLGGGRFEDVSAATGIGSRAGPGLGAAVADFNGDGRLDLFVANDQAANFLWVRSDSADGAPQTFRNIAPAAGCAVSGQGQPEASMGVAVADPDADGDPDILLTHLNRETHTLYVNTGQGLFYDETPSTALAGGSRPYTGFGAGWLDIDNDGRLDLFLAHGEVKALGDLLVAGDPFPYHQPNQLWRHLGNWRLQDVSSLAGDAFKLSEVSRGAAFGDIDNDGDIDILLTQNGGPARLLLNHIGHRSAWIGLELIDRDGHRHPPGTRVEVVSSAGPPQWRTVQTGGSYASASDPRLLFGLGDHQAPVTARVHWLSGLVEEWPELVPGKYSEIHEGQGVSP